MDSGKGTPDMNENIEVYRRSTDIRPNIRHIPATLMEALQDSDKPMTDDDREMISLQMLQRKPDKSSKKMKPTHTVGSDSKVSDALDRKRALRSRMMSHYNPLVDEDQEHHHSSRSGDLPAQASTSSCMSGRSISLCVIIAVLVFILIGLVTAFVLVKTKQK